MQPLMLIANAKSWEDQYLLILKVFSKIHLNACQRPKNWYYLARKTEEKSMESWFKVFYVSKSPLIMTFTHE